MYAYTTRVTLQAGQGAAGTRRWREIMLPMLRQQPGFLRLVVLQDDAHDRGMAILLWDSEADFAAAVPAFNALATEHLHPLIDMQGAMLNEGFAVTLDEAI